MMNERAASLLATLSIRGVVVIPEGRLLRLRPRAALTPDLLAQVRTLKAELMAILTSGAMRQLAAAGAWPSREEWCVLAALARQPRLTEKQLHAATQLPFHRFAPAVNNLLLRGEIKKNLPDGRLCLRVS